MKEGQHQSTRGPAHPSDEPKVHFVEGPKLIGKTVDLLTDGNILTPNVPVKTFADGTVVRGYQPQQILSYEGPAAHYVVSTEAVIQEAGNDLVNTWPLANFIINWTIGGTDFQTRIDGQSDQFLSLVAERITVTGAWDDENGVTPGLSLNFPKRMTLAASLARGDGLPTKAFRSRLLGVDEDGSPINAFLPIPYAAKGYIVRSGVSTDWFGVSVFHVTEFPASVVDRYTAANVLAAHDRGEYLSVPSLADFITQAATVPNPSFPGIVEFLMQM